MPTIDTLAAPAAPVVAPSRAMQRTGWAISGLAAAFLLFDGAARVVGFAPYAEGTVRAGYPVEVGVSIGLVLIACTVLYVIPGSAVLGAILLTGYLGGATATNLRTADPFLFPAVFGMFVWLGLYLRDPRLRTLLPFRRDAGR
jgi:hypothetical protein